MNNCKRAIIDCDYVINKLDEKNLNAWLFRAKGYHGLGHVCEYEKCIAEARKNHPKRLPYIDEVIRVVASEQKQMHTCASEQEITTDPSRDDLRLLTEQ